MQLLKIYFSDAESYYKVKSLAKCILNKPDELLFFVKNRVIKMCESTHFKDCTVYYWYDFITDKYYVCFSINNLASIKICISGYELRRNIISF